MRARRETKYKVRVNVDGLCYDVGPAHASTADALHYAVRERGLLYGTYEIVPV